MKGLTFETLSRFKTMPLSVIEFYHLQSRQGLSELPKWQAEYTSLKPPENPFSLPVYISIWSIFSAEIEAISQVTRKLPVVLRANLILLATFPKIQFFFLCKFCLMLHNICGKLNSLLIHQWWAVCIRNSKEDIYLYFTRAIL